MAPNSTSLFRLIGFFENFRIETRGPRRQSAAPPRSPEIHQATARHTMDGTRRPDARQQRTILLMIRNRCGLILETHTKRFEHAPTFDIDAFVAVDKNIADGRILEQRFERAKPDQLIDDFSNE